MEEEEVLVSEEHVQTLLNMGIRESDAEIRNALKQTGNNLEDALQILLPDTERQLSYGTDDMETRADSSCSDHDSTTATYSLEPERIQELVDDSIEYHRDDDSMGEELPHPQYHEDNSDPPCYQDVVDEHKTLPSSEEQPSTMEEEDETPPPLTSSPVPPLVSNIEFPLTHFYELEGRVHTEQWSIPYKKEESLGKCLLASIAMMKEGPGVAEADENCVKFLERTMPCAFDKLLAHDAVYRWEDAIMRGIREMLHILVELISIRLTYSPVPCYLLNLLAVAFNADNAFHTRNKSRRTNPSHWVDALGDDKVLAVMPSFTTRKDCKGWLVELMNVFTQHGGLTAIQRAIRETENLTLQELTALFQPFSNCDDYINPSVFKAEMADCMQFALKYVEDLKDDSLKDKEVGCVFDLLKNLKTLLRRCSIPDTASNVDTLRLNTTLRMFNIPHFNAKMNALKEVVKLTEEPYSAARAGVKNPIPPEKVKRWLIENKVLSIAFGGNLHQAQYCDKVKSIVEFLGTELSMDELSTIWDMQVDKNPAQVENIHVILAHAASRFTPQHLDHLFHLIQQSWDSVSSDRYREKLLELIGKIGRDDRTGKTASKILELLWQLAHSPQLSREMVELALNSHCTILIDSFHIKDSEKKVYITKCVEDIKKGQVVVAAIRQLHRLAKGMYRSSHGHKDQQHISELQKQHDMLRLVSATLNKVHAKTVQMCKDNNEELSGDTITDGRYTHEECVDSHLQFMAFLLQDGALYLPTKRAVEVWDALITNPDACLADRRLAFKWFDMSMNDMELETQTQLYHKRVLKVDPLLLDLAGYHCIRSFFEAINLAERKLRRLQHSQQLIIDSQDLSGIEYLWKAALEVRDSFIADELINNILQISYNLLSPKLKRETAALHKNFIHECFLRLQSLLEPTDEAALDHDLRILSIERLLLLTQRYITMVEENHSYPRHMPPHGACFRGYPILLDISADQHQTTFQLECHSNESLLSVREKIAQHLKVAPEQLQMGTAEKWLGLTHYNKLIHQLKFTDGQNIIVKTNLGSFSTGVEVSGNAERMQAALKQEKQLPGVMMASEKDFFNKLEQLCQLGEPRVIFAVRNLLKLIPINHRVLEALDVFVHQTPHGASDDNQAPPTPSEVLKEFFDASNVSQTQLLYNLEVLNGKLMPAITTTTDSSAQLFRRNFLEAGGLQFVINILQKNALPPSTDLSIRQDCYAVVLSLSRFLLCAPPLPPPLQDGEDKDTEEQLSSQQHTPPLQHQVSKGLSVEDEVARLTIETMPVKDFSTTLLCLMRVCWAAAAGQLHLASGNFDGEDEKEGQEEEEEEKDKEAESTCLLKLGICSKNKTATGKDAGIARESLELLATCIKLRSSLLNEFYSLPLLEEFVMDVLLGSAHPDIRTTLVECFKDLCDDVGVDMGVSTSVDAPTSQDEPQQPKRPRSDNVPMAPRHFFLHLLLSNQSSLWMASSTSPSELEVWGRSEQYFEFLRHLLSHLSKNLQQLLSVDVHQILQKEILWLNEVNIPPTPCLAVQTLLAGHLKLCGALISCTGVDKQSYCKTLIPKLLSEFLFPASTVTLDSQGSRQTGIVNVNPKCCTIQSRVAAYNVLVELADGCLDNLKAIAYDLITLHHTDQPRNAKEWEFRPLVEGRSFCGFVGLKNAGATCYMNSVLQQLFVQPEIKESILSVEREDEEGESEGDRVLNEVQVIFGHLMESRLQYYSPESFWKTFKFEGQPINVHEHQDASEFFSSLTDQVDEALKKRGHAKPFEKRFGGTFLDQIICHGCEHTFDKEQGFTSLQLSVVQSRSLRESLQEFVRGDMLEGDNRYLCGDCQEKRDTLKRTCIKVLPPVLVVHLKRFDYDWETNREIKFNNYFEFPWMLDMEPYTVEGIMSREKGLDPGPEQWYELTGVVVHQGQATAGHYYAFIKDKRRTLHSNSTIPEEEELPESAINRWLKFNDTLVQEFDLNDITLESECFGGSLKNSNTDTFHGSHPDSRVRHWNAYMLFYEAVHPTTVETSTATKPERVSPGPGLLSPMSPFPGEDKLSQLQELVQKGESRGVFSDRMPSQIQRSVNDENLQFMQNRDVYCREYFTFVHQLTFCNKEIANSITHESRVEYAQVSVQLAIKFLLRTFFRTYRDLRIIRDEWVKDMEQLLRKSSSACEWLVNFLATPPGANSLKPFLLEATSKEVRHDFCAIVGCAMQSYCSFNGMPADGSPLDAVVSQILQLLEKDVADNWKTCSEYFMLLKSYASNQHGCQHLLAKDVFVSLVQFLLGPSRATDSVSQRRWTSLQVKEFGFLHCTISLLVCNTDVSVFESEVGPEEEAPMSNPYMIPSKHSDLCRPSDGMHQALFTLEQSRKLIKECVLMLRESDNTATDSISTMLCYCSWNNQSFSACVIEDLQTQIHGVPPNELKSYFRVLTDILMIEDRLQDKRISFTLIGGKYKPEIALFDTITGRAASDSKRTYQGIKFLVGLANKCKKAREYLLTQADQLQSAVSWLRRKINEYTWSHSSTYSNESSSSRVFQRTVSAVDTLEEANALLNELEARDARQKMAATTSKSSSSSSTQDKYQSTSSNRQGDNIEG